MKFKRYTDVDEFQGAVLDVLLENEVENNLPVSILVDCSRENSKNWLMSTVTDDNDNILLVAICTKPFNIMLIDVGASGSVAGASGSAGDAQDIQSAVLFLADELKHIGFAPPGVIAKAELAQMFSKAYCGDEINSKHHMSMIIMKLDKLSDYKKAPGYCRVLCTEDLNFTPFWERDFSIECKIPVFDVGEYKNRIQTRLGRNIHYIWVDEVPVAQAVWGRTTPNSAAVSWVFTPPEHRGKGYATSVVAELSRSILKSGKTSCCLFADAANPVSTKIYRSIGYYDVCTVDEIKFDIP